ncbi:nuclease-related domain-containing protein [Kamptonema cortianum]|nr:nuclease-related domain-containing protein [Kamptonema cortianum]
MRIETNSGLIRRNRQLAQILFFVSFGVLIAGLFVINSQNPGDTEFLSVVLPIVILPLAFIMTMLSVRMTNLWVRQPRPEIVIQEALRGSGNKNVLYHYFHFPARHVLVTPNGVYAMVTRFQDGHFSVSGDRWTTHRGFAGRMLSLFRFDGIGNPSTDAKKAADHVQQMLAPIAPDVRVQPLVIFVDPRARLDIQDPTVPVLFADPKLQPNLKEYIRKKSKEPGQGLTQEQIEAFDTATFG